MSPATLFQLFGAILSFSLGWHLFQVEIDKDKQVCEGMLSCRRWSEHCAYFDCYNGCLDRKGECHPLEPTTTMIPFVLVCFTSAIIFLSAYCHTKR